MAITKAQLQTIRQDIAAALKSVEAKHSINLDLGNIGYTANEFHGKLTGSTVSASGVDEAKEAKWKQYAPRFGLATNLFGKQFTQKGKKFTITEISPRSSKYPVIVEDAAGNGYKFTASAINSLKIK